MSDKEIIKLYFCKKCKRFLGTENYYQGKGYCELRFMKGGNANSVENVAETGINVTETAEKCTSTVPGYTKHSIAKHTSSSTGSSKPVKEGSEGSVYIPRVLSSWGESNLGQK